MKTIYDRLNRYAGGAFGSCTAGGSRFTPEGSISAATVQSAIAELDSEKQIFPPPTPISVAATSQALTAGTAYYSVYPMPMAYNVMRSIEWFIAVSDAASTWYVSIYAYAASGSFAKLAGVTFADNGTSTGFKKIALSSNLVVEADKIFTSFLIVGGAARLLSRASTVVTDTVSFSASTGLSAPPTTESAARTTTNWQPYILLR